MAQSQDGDPTRTDTVTIEVRRGLAEEMAEILWSEIAVAPSYYATEQYMDEFKALLEDALAEGEQTTLEDCGGEGE